MRIYEDLRGVQSRLTIVRNVILALLMGLIVVFWHLQVHRGRYYLELADKNRTRTVALRAPRGPLLDRGGQGGIAGISHGIKLSACDWRC